jgi:hypothetical protein
MSGDPDSPKVLATVRTDMEAALVVNHLATQGIKAFVSGVGTSTGWPEAPGDVQVVVRQSDFERAKESLDLVRHTRGEREADERKAE